LNSTGFYIDSCSGTYLQGYDVPEKFVNLSKQCGIDTSSLANEGRIYQFLITCAPKSGDELLQSRISKQTTYQHPFISIVILTRNQLKYTKKCIESIVTHTKETFEIILIDNGSTDGTIEYFESELTKLISEDRLQVIKNNENLGFAKGNNQGMAAARGNYILLMNNDVVVTPGWLSKMIKCAEKSPMIGIVGPKSNYVSGPQLVRKVSYDTKDLNGLERFSAEFAKNNSQKATPFWRVVGFCMLIKKAVIDKIGGLDGRYGLGNFEDDDFSLRATLAGYESRIANDCFVHHFGNRTFAGEKIDYQKSLNKNWEVFKKKWGIPEDLPYGSSYDLGYLVKDGFVQSKHFVPFLKDPDLPEAKAKPSPQVVSNPQMVKYHEIQQMLAREKQKEAKDALELLLIDNPEFALGHNDLGVLCYQDGDMDKALEHYELAVKLQPENKNFVKNLADFYYVELGHIEDALKLYNETLYIDPEDIEALLIIGHICVSLKKFDDAKTFYARVLDIDPLNKDARQMINRLLNNEQTQNPEIIVSIIIPTAGRQKNLENCLRSIEKYTPESYEIIFVDNGCSRGTLKWLKSIVDEKPNYRKVKCLENSNFADIYNAGIKASKGEYILLLSNDVIVTKSWLSNMLECMKSAPDVGVVGPMSNHAIGQQKAATARKVSVDQINQFAESFMSKKRHRRISSFALDGLCLLFGCDLVKQIGLFDEKFDSCGYEDEDFCLRAVIEGRKNYIAGDVYVHRNSSRASSKTRMYFNEKWNRTDAQSPSGKKYLTLKAIEKGVDVYQKGHFEKAVEILLEGIGLSTGDKRPYYVLAEILLSTDNFKDAIDVLNEMPPGELDVKRLELLGYCKNGMDLNKEAESITDKILIIDGRSAVAQNLKGLLAFKQGDLKLANDYFRKAIEMDPGYGEPYTNLGAIQWDKDKKEAISLFEKGFILSPTSQDVLTNYYSAVNLSAEFARAEQVFQEASLLHKNNKMIRYQLIDILIKQKKNVKAMEQIEEAMALYGTDDGIISAALRIRELIGPKEIKKSKNKKNTVSLCMIVKNEEEYLARCLKSVKPVVDEMIIVDTGSTDSTKEIARAFGAKVYDYEWADNFAEARNFSISKASGSWTFHLDADEVISSHDYAAFRKIIRQSATKRIAFLINTRNYTMDVNQVGWTANDGHYEKEESATGWIPSEKVRLFRKDRNIRFDYHIHELVEPSLKKAGVELKKCSIPVHHYGKLNKEKSNKKLEIYYQIGRKKLDQTGGNAVAIRELAIQAEIIGKHDEAIELWERFIAIEPNEPNAYINMGISYCSLGNYEGVVETAKKAMRLEPDLKEAHYNYALGKLHLGRVEEAVSTLEKLLERLDKYPPAQFLSAAAYCCGGKKQKGLIELKALKKSSIGPGLPIRCHELAKGLVSSDRYDYALLLLEAAIDSKNSNKDVLELYSKCLDLMNVNKKTGTMGDL
jgi:GT2 family glycosyltransferase/Tfp pilus assembly protein PilF